MATITPVVNTDVRNVPRIIWEELATGDTIEFFQVNGQWGLAASIQVTGTFGGATVTLQHSNDGVTWFTAKDMQNSNILFTGNGIAEFSLSSAYFRPGISGGTGDDVDVVIVSRGKF